MINTNKILIIAWLVLAGLFPASSALAAALLYESHDNQQAFVVDVYLNTEGQSINALQGSLAFPDKLLQFQGANDANSVVSFWIKPPVRSGARLDFSGAIPGGYSGGRGFLFSLIFKKLDVAQSQEGSLQLDKFQAFINDGLGTVADSKKSQLAFTLAPGHIIQPLIAGDFQDKKDADHTPPQPFIPQVSRSSNAFNGAWFALSLIPISEPKRP